ncbi:TetR/AcrR family transcriptional regulator [Jatrophihabitans cynanchi]|jgi:AcrR family transcriptional regulator|uniref:TetR/AcrR family transcriptional regulator n=1 Tax=Jatrophihabitans cynanchi TaxID=2944128 RepID=A0ABY7K0Q5_9ACTN|nr:TetR/AcrR family transcriptional regulator [Jatrophihabitans sp. SB3-54]WAX57755.1 TetR/AcrR family transcriptional regulator [Jatrophihabitans sp. SB3-54]
MTGKPRTQKSRSAATREALVSAARTLFAARGYADVGTEEIVRTAGLTRGALYHHFADKEALFAAAFEEVEVETNVRILQAVESDGTADPIAAMQLGAAAFLDVCTEPEMARIMLLDAPSVLGWERWTEISNQHNMGLVQALLTRAAEVGRIPAQPIPPLAHTLLGALREAALFLARADDRAQARSDVGAVMDLIIRSIGSA